MGDLSLINVAVMGVVVLLFLLLFLLAGELFWLWGMWIGLVLLAFSLAWSAMHGRGTRR